MHGLPRSAFVFCNFNTIDKVEPIVFNTWMQLLAMVPNSVLWLLRPKMPVATSTMTNLKSEAAAHGIKPERLIFAKRIPKYEHFKR